MAFVDHLVGNAPETKFLEVAFGRHVIAGDLAKSIVTGTSPNHVVTIQQMLGEAFGKGWAGVVGLWFKGVNRPPAKFKFYPGIMSPGNTDTTQGIDATFNLDTPHSNSAWVRVELPSGSETGIPDANTKTSPPTGLYGIYNCQRGDIYDNAGAVTATNQFLVNPADVLAFGCREIRRYPISRIDWAALDALRQYCAEPVTPDYTTLSQGVGLTGKYYDGTNFNTFKNQRVDPVIQFDSSLGAPALDINVDSFSVRWQGKIRPRYTQTYTFYVTHDNGARLFVNNLTTPIINSWANDGTSTPGTDSATISLTSDQFYDIKIEWNEGGSAAQMMVEWQSASQSRQVVPQDRLYPYAEPRARYECHLAFTERTTFEEFLTSVLFTCNGAFQDVGGKLKFFTLDGLAPSFDFTEANSKKNTFKYYPRFSQQEFLNLPNRYLADGRDLDSRYLEKFDPPMFFDLPDMQAAAGRVIESVVGVGNTSRPQAHVNLAHFAKLATAPMVAEFEGLPATYPVLPGDIVSVTSSLSGFVNKTFIVVEATDKSIDDGADERIFKCYEWA